MKKIPEDHAVFLSKPFALAIDSDVLDQDEADILAKYGSWLEALANRQIQPYTSKQEKFVEFSSRLDQPSTRYESIWRKYQIEVLWSRAVEMEKDSYKFGYERVRRNFEQLASLGDSRAAAWLKNEGNWSPETYPEKRAQWAFGELLDALGTGGGSVSAPVSTDEWPSQDGLNRSSQDDWSESDWEAWMMGPDEQYFES